MKRNLVSAVLALTLAASFAGSVAFAQDPAVQNQSQAATETGHGRHMHDPHRMAMHLSKELGLTADQTANVEPILAERQQKMMALRGDTSLTPEQKHAQMHAIGKSTQDELAGVLTPEQMEKVKTMHKGHKGAGVQGAPAGA